MNPRMHMKLLRNHFTDSPQNPLCGSSVGFYNSVGYHTTVAEEPLSASVRAAQWSITYRFAWINAVFNDKVLSGDDMSVLEQEE